MPILDIVILSCLPFLVGVAIAWITWLGWFRPREIERLEGLIRQKARETEHAAYYSRDISGRVVDEYMSLALIVTGRDPMEAENWPAVYRNAGVQQGDSYSHGMSLKEVGVVTQTLQDAGIEHRFQHVFHKDGLGEVSSWEVHVRPHDLTDAERLLKSALQGSRDARERLIAVETAKATAAEENPIDDGFFPEYLKEALAQQPAAEEIAFARLAKASFYDPSKPIDAGRFDNPSHPDYQDLHPGKPEPEGADSGSNGASRSSWSYDGYTPAPGVPQIRIPAGPARVGHDLIQVGLPNLSGGPTMSCSGPGSEDADVTIVLQSEHTEGFSGEDLETLSGQLSAHHNCPLSYGTRPLSWGAGPELMLGKIESVATQTLESSRTGVRETETISIEIELMLPAFQYSRLVERFPAPTNTAPAPSGRPITEDMMLDAMDQLAQGEEVRSPILDVWATGAKEGESRLMPQDRSSKSLAFAEWIENHPARPLFGVLLTDDGEGVASISTALVVVTGAVNRTLAEGGFLSFDGSGEGIPEHATIAVIPIGGPHTESFGCTAVFVGASLCTFANPRVMAFAKEMDFWDRLHTFVVGNPGPFTDLLVEAIPRLVTHMRECFGPPLWDHSTLYVEAENILLAVEKLQDRGTQFAVEFSSGSASAAPFYRVMVPTMEVAEIRNIFKTHKLLPL